MRPHPRVVCTKSPEETAALGERLAEELKPGACVALIGELGAGKTTLIKGLARGLGVPEKEVLSPTFVLVREHRGGRLPLFHVDAYRLAGPEELQEIGLEEYLLSEGITVIEWADRIPQALPPGCLEIRLEIISERERRITLG
ncbi:MAG: tRNA (adenosine(37)-N6)-threonylcarbamoyltransferase complex ATPase subunit type 1 TsaE [Candidatus Acetothermia bacterium]|jgi:tRNA threonylcarbamoyladenosine biosynthesis protein TsaE|nr:tRNA (adenosine(37)-N6)-threonylcarbamoyltransferase complex ATPase subunit type 1 TsaE [Candidatus Acetothermia bacterium]MDH7504815.1 tRNA (adenosine(37)-N6)-threonylcarbamoyltransferase complex ATPase subunit type 1 TsaE [Candidatus Acetothermia bacterium]